MGIETLGEYAGPWAWGRKPASSWPGSQAGVVAGPAYTSSIGGTWYEGSVLSAAIGHENNQASPPSSWPT